MLDLPCSDCKIKSVQIWTKRGHVVEKLMRIGFILSILGFVFYLLCPGFLDSYAEIGRSGGLILFALGWALLLGSLFFNLGISAQKSRGRD